MNICERDSIVGKGMRSLLFSEATKSFRLSFKKRYGERERERAITCEKECIREG